MRHVVWWALRVYQLTLSGIIGRHCRFEPTCSHYAQAAVLRYGVVKGGQLALKRLARCGPFGGHGYDPLPTELPAREKRKAKGGEGCGCGKH